jgi:uncharacterized damage-inducible protein DinB
MGTCLDELLPARPPMARGPQRRIAAMAATVRETIQQLATTMLATLEVLAGLSDDELAEPSSHVCAQGKDVWTLLTNDIDHETIHVGQILEARYEARTTPSSMQRLIGEWLLARSRLIGAYVGLTDEQLQQETAPGGWSYAQVAAHTLRVEETSLQNLLQAIAERSASPAG